MLSAVVLDHLMLPIEGTDMDVFQVQVLLEVPVAAVCEPVLHSCYVFQNASMRYIHMAAVLVPELCMFWHEQEADGAVEGWALSSLTAANKLQETTAPLLCVSLNFACCHEQEADGLVEGWALSSLTAANKLQETTAAGRQQLTRLGGILAVALGIGLLIAPFSILSLVFNVR